MRLNYEIAATGEGQIRSVLRGVEREAQASNRRMARDAQTTAQRTARSGATPLGTGQREQAAQIRQQERATVAAERARVREAIAASRAEQRARLNHEKDLNRAKESLDKQRSRGLMQNFSAQERHERRALAARQATFKSIGRGAATSVGRGAGNVLRAGGAVGGVLGGLAIGSALSEESSIRREASLLANQAGTPGAKNALAAESTSVRGQTGTETLQGMGKFVGKTGDLDTARAIKGSMGELSLATGAEFGDLMETAGQAFNVLKDQISDPVERIKQLNSLMGVLAQQGAMGAVEIKDLAQDFGKLGAATRGFEGGSPALLRTMGAFAQIAVARGGAESSADASTAASRLVGDIVTHKKRFAALGVGIQSKKDPTKLADPMQIMADTLEKTKGDVMKTSGLFGLESGKIFKGLAATYSEAEKKKKGSGRAAVMGEFQRFAGAEMSPAALKAQADSRAADPDLQFKEAMKQFNREIGTKLLPAVTQLVPKFVELVPFVGQMTDKLAQFLGWFAQNPVTGIGALIAASVTRDMAASGIQAALSSGVSGLLSALPPAALGVAKFAGAAALAAAAIYAAYEQNEALKKETGGKGILDVAGELLQGKGLKEIADENLDKQAKAEAAQRNLTPGNVSLSQNAPNGAAPAPNGVPGAPGTGAAAAGGAGVVKGGAALERAAAALEKAAAAMPKGGGGNGTPPSRTAPIVAPSRG